MRRRVKIAVVTPDVLSQRMAGPAIRATAIAEHLAALGHEVTLVSTASCDIDRPGMTVTSAARTRLRPVIGDADVVIVQGYVTYYAPWLVSSDKVLVVDLYDPVHLEQIEQVGELPEGERRAMLDLTVRVLNEQLLRGDFFLCASEEQRRLWIGHLAALGRINDLTYGADSSLRSLIDIVPFGLPVDAPVRTGPGIRGVTPGIGHDDKLVLWAGGVYNWFDPLTLLHAVDAVRREHPDVRLFFLGMKHPNPDVPAMAVAHAARTLSDELGLTGVHVFFNEGWVPYDRRQDFLLDADVGVSTHFDHLETAFSFRTRILDYLWAGLPVVATDGDTFGALIRAEGLGVAVPEQDVPALAAALTTLLYDPDAVASARVEVERVRDQFAWPRALASLASFCADPHRAADGAADRLRIARRATMPRNPALRALTRVALLVRRGGLKAVVRKLRARRRRETTGLG